MAGAALATAQPVIVEKLGAEKQFADLALRKLDIVSALTVPLHVDNKPFGTLGVYTTQERALAKRDVCFAETIAHMLTNSIARSRTEQQLSDHRKRTSTILKIIESLVFELDSEFKLVSMNRACRDATGFTLREIVGKPFSSVFVIPEELDLVQGILRSSVRDRAICEFESSLLTNDGEQRRVAWSLSVLRDDDGTPKSILLTGTDRTELADAQLRLEKAEALAQQAATQLQELRQEVAEQVKTSGRPAVVDGRPEGPPADGEDTSGPDGSNPVQEDEPANTTRREPAPETDDTPSPSMIRLPNGSLGPEARTSVRRSFHYKQLIAPMYGSVIPSRKEFFQVRCENISAGGFAFYIEREPDFEHLIVALGQGTALTYFSARIVRVMKKDVDGEELHLVGCRFSGRIHL